MLETAIDQFLAQSSFELIAALCALAYLVLALRQNIWCWPFALVSTALYTWVFFDALLLMDSLLNIYYMVMAVYGFWRWRFGHPGEEKLKISTWSWRNHYTAVGLIIGLSAVSGYLLKNTDAVWPYLDSFTTWGSVVTTYMVARKIFENWYYWLIIDSVALFLYIDRGLNYTALLMVIYLVLVLIGIYSWSKDLKKSKNETTP